LALPLYALTLFVSAFILFLVQPMIGKMILPKLGGTPQVWNTCMVFFQMVLLAGYAYTHFTSSRLRPRQQLLLHSVLLLVPFVVLFVPAINLFTLRSEWVPSNLGGNPIPDTLWILTLVIGVPFLIVSTSAPLLQKWFGYTGHPAAKDPYFLYGASNLGSLLSLLLYPTLIEPDMSVVHQTWLWTIGYGLLVILVLACVAFVWVPSLRFDVPHVPAADEKAAELAAQAAAQVAAQPSTAVASGTPKGGPTGLRKGKPPHRGGLRAELPADPALSIRGNDELAWGRRLRWVLLAAIPSSLMLGITTHITTDLSPIPLFWLIPLSLYLLSFILVFARWPVVWTETPHRVMLYLQPVAIVVMLFVDYLSAAESRALWASISFLVIGFFLTTMVCHGELAKDRPSARHLTEFYLWMSVGGVVGGMFNALFAPIIFKKLLELGVAIAAGCLIRPTMRESGWIDDYVSGLLEQQPEAPAAPARGGRPARGPAPVVAKAGANSSLAYSLDVVLPLLVLVLAFALAFMIDPNDPGRTERDRRPFLHMFLAFGIPLVIAGLFFARPLRFGLAVGAIMITYGLYNESRGGGSDYSDRSFFGIISVKKSAQNVKMNDGDPVRSEYYQLIHGHINHGMNFVKPSKQEDWGNPNKDFSRLATTYYHRLGPAGLVMEQYNWFHPREDNVHTADARMPASLVGQLLGNPGAGALPYAAFVDLWSEPPYATVGLGTGTMASYGRPFQHVHYYEIDNQIRRLSLPERGDTAYFNYLQEAKKRGCEVQVLMGDARLRMALPYLNHYAKDKQTGEEIGELRGGGPENFYHMMVVDAFSSDAIPAHLITKEGIRMYFDHLVEEGILCVHTSNRYVDLPRVVAAVTADLGFACLRGHDNAPFHKTGHFTSEWVMVARKAEYLGRLKELEPAGYEEAVRKTSSQFEPYWTIPTPNSRYLWTDDYYNLMSVVR
jgi:hypothetical protein